MREAVLEKIIGALEGELEVLTRSARESFAAATDPDSKAENKYDTRSLEASYVARGQAQRVAELQDALHRFRALAKNLPENDEPVDIGHLVSVVLGGETAHFFIGPAAGGLQVEHEGRLVDVITPASPMGQRLMGEQAVTRL